MIFLLMFFIFSLFALLSYMSISKKKTLPAYLKHILFIMYGIFFILLIVFSIIYLQEKVSGNGKNSFIIGSIFLLASYLNISLFVFLPNYLKKKENMVKSLTFILFTVFLFLSLFFFFRFGRLNLDNEIIESSSSLLKIFRF